MLPSDARTAPLLAAIMARGMSPTDDVQFAVFEAATALDLGAKTMGRDDVNRAYQRLSRKNRLRSAALAHAVARRVCETLGVAWQRERPLHGTALSAIKCGDGWGYSELSAMVDGYADDPRTTALAGAVLAFGTVA